MIHTETNPRPHRQARFARNRFDERSILSLPLPRSFFIGRAARAVRRISTIEPTPLHRRRSNVDGDSEGTAVAAAVHVVAVSGITAFECGSADFIDSASDAAAGVASPPTLNYKP